MEKYYIKKEKISEKVNDLISSSKIPNDYLEILGTKVKRVTKTIRDNQYLVIEVGSGLHVYNVDSAKVPLEVRKEFEDNIDSVFYI